MPTICQQKTLKVRPTPKFFSGYKPGGTLASFSTVVLYEFQITSTRT